MTRKPAIFLFALLLLFSIGGAVFLQHLRHEKQTSFTEVDSFLINHAASGDWHFGRHLSKPPYKHPLAGWWDHLLIRRSDHFQTDQYFYGHASKEHAAMQQRADARLKEMEKSIFGKFPQFSPEVVPEFP